MNEPQQETGGLLHHLRVSVVATIVLAILCCGVYPMVVWGLSQAIFHNKANGSLIRDQKGSVIGSRLIGQLFSDAKYFHPRPSAAGSGYDPTSSSGSNLGPTSAKLLYGTTKDSVFTIIVHDSAHAAADLPGRVEATFLSSGNGQLTAWLPPAADATTKPATYHLDPAAVVTAQGRALSKTTPAKDANVELKAISATQPAIIAATVIDKAVEGTVAFVDVSNSKLRVRDPKTGVLTDYAVANSPLVIVNEKTDAKLADVPVEAQVRILTATVEDNDGIADRVIHYCEDNHIDCTCGIDRKTFEDDDGIDDVKLITAFNAATGPHRAITTRTPVPADAVTASASGLDPHISVENALLQAQRVAEARKIGKDAVVKLIHENTEGRDLGIFGDPGVNVVMLNLALDKIR